MRAAQLDARSFQATRLTPKSAVRCSPQGARAEFRARCSKYDFVCFPLPIWTFLPAGRRSIPSNLELDRMRACLRGPCYSLAHFEAAYLECG